MNSTSLGDFGRLAKSFFSPLRGAILVAVACLTGSPAALAQLTLNTTYQGSFSYSNPGIGSAHVPEWIQAQRTQGPGGGSVVTNAYFVFELPPIETTLLGATLEFDVALISRVGGGSNVGLSVWDVSTSIGTLVGSPVIFNPKSRAQDLESGVLFGGETFGTSLVPVTLSIPLNATFLAQASLFTSGGLFAVGLSVDPVASASIGLVLPFLSTAAGDGDVRLRLDVEQAAFAPVPEPSTYGIMGVATLAAVLVVRRRRATSE